MNFFLVKQEVEDVTTAVYNISSFLGHETRRTDTDLNGYRDFFAKLARKIPVSVESVRSSCSISHNQSFKFSNDESLNMVIKVYNGFGIKKLLFDILSIVLFFF